MKDKIATPFGLAMTTNDVKIFNGFVLVIPRGGIVEGFWVIKKIQKGG
jgi:hypothetical protein